MVYELQQTKDISGTTRVRSLASDDDKWMCVSNKEMQSGCGSDLSLLLCFNIIRSMADS
jgi:hypothetical protein